VTNHPEPITRTRKDGTPWVEQPASGLPARGYTRPPFASGNAAHLAHGARTRRVYGPVAEELAAGLVEDRPDLHRYPEAVAAWATAEAQCLLMRRHVEQVGTLDDDGEPRASLLTWLSKFESAAAKHRARLGLDPMAEASLARERAAASVLAVDVEATLAAGREALARREAAGLPAPRDVAGEALELTAREGAAVMARARAETKRLNERATDDGADSADD